MTDRSSRARIEDALEEIRREARKVALVHALVDAAAVCLLASLALLVVESPVSRLEVAVPLVDAAVPGVERVAVDGPQVAGVLAGAGVFVVEYTYLVRRPVVEQFEAANPEIEEALRTARDAAASGTESVMAATLYEDVLARLRETSSLGLVDSRRLAATALVAVMVAVASVQIAAMGLTVSGLLGPGETGPAGDAQSSPTYDGLQDGEDIMGEETDVDSGGDDTIEASVSSSGQGSTNQPNSAAQTYGSSGSAGGPVESQQARYASSDTPEDAELIREYNLEIREESEND